uniref:Solute carrier family 43 member 3b n=1 Tax=Oryzias latipes TaxID=8090 RepID=H2LF43_ORYLA
MPESDSKFSVKRGLTFITGLVECLCFAGAVFGWASLVFVLKEEGYFSSMCVNTTTVNGTQSLDCSAQDEQFSLVFTIASFLNNFLTLPNGFLFDRFGTTVARLFGIFLYTMGTLMVSFSTAALGYLLFPALSLLAVGGILFLMTNMQVGNLFGSRRSTIITLYNGAFDSSSALFLIIKLLHEAGISLRGSFLFLSACSVAHILRTLFLLPRNFIPYPLPDHYTYGMNCGKSETERTEVATNSPHKTAEEAPLTKDAPVKQERSFRECVMSRFFVWHLLWLSVMQLRHYLFIGTLNPMLQRLTAGESSLVSQYTNAFAVTQLCGVLCAPWNGLIMDRHKSKPRAAGTVKIHFSLYFFLTLLHGGAVVSALTSQREPPGWNPGWGLSLWSFHVVLGMCLSSYFHRRDGAGGRPTCLCAFSVPDGAAVRAVFRVRLQPFPAAAVPHLRPAGAQPLLPLWRQRSFPERSIPILPLWKAVRFGHGPVRSLLHFAVSLLCSGERGSERRSFICKHCSDTSQSVGLHPPPVCVPALSTSRLSAIQEQRHHYLLLKHRLLDVEFY